MSVRSPGNPYGSIIKNTGTLELITPVWKTIPFPSMSGKLDGVNDPTWSVFTTNTKQYAFAINDYIDLPVYPIPDDYKEGSDFGPFVLVVTNGVDVDNRVIRIEAARTLANIGDVVTETLVAGNLTIPANTPDRTVIKFGGIVVPGNGVGVTIDAFTNFRITRGTPGAGTPPSNDPFLVFFGLYYQVDTMGSRQPGIK